MNLSGANLTNASFERTKLRGAILSRADLSAAFLYRADLAGATARSAKFVDCDLREASFLNATLERAKFVRADLESADLRHTNSGLADFSSASLRKTNLHSSRLIGARFEYASLVGTNLANSNLTGAFVYGISAWDVDVSNAVQANLVITERTERTIQVDNLEVAQFIYLLLKNEKIRHVIDTITSKIVLILGRFSPERKAVLDAMRDELRKRDYLPVLFDFEKPSNRDITETVSTLAHMAKFVIADITDAKSIPQELMAIVPALPSVPVQPLLLASQREYGMFEHFKRFPWVLEPYLYEDQDRLLAALTKRVIGPAEAKAKEQIGR